MDNDANRTTAEARAEIRKRIADRLGLILAKRWLRVRQNTESGQKSPGRDGSQPKQGKP